MLMDQPRASLEMITRFTKGMPLDQDPPFTRVVTDSSIRKWKQRLMIFIGETRGIHYLVEMV